MNRSPSIGNSAQKRERTAKEMNSQNILGTFINCFLYFFVPNMVIARMITNPMSRIPSIENPPYLPDASLNNPFPEDPLSLTVPKSNIICAAINGCLIAIIKNNIKTIMAQAVSRNGS